MRWNRSEYFAIAVGRLADRIVGGSVLTRKVDTGGEPITRDKVELLQADLALLGFDAGKADGVFGPATRRALSRFQKANDMIADGHLNRKALQAVRNSAAAL
jgi:membrane-bound lytic murein transglycosylase B